MLSHHTITTDPINITTSAIIIIINYHPTVKD